MCTCTHALLGEDEQKEKKNPPKSFVGIYSNPRRSEAAEAVCVDQGGGDKHDQCASLNLHPGTVHLTVCGWDAQLCVPVGLNYTFILITMPDLIPPHYMHPWRGRPSTAHGTTPIWSPYPSLCVSSVLPVNTDIQSLSALCYLCSHRECYSTGLSVCFLLFTALSCMNGCLDLSVYWSKFVHVGCFLSWYPRRP